MVMSISGTSDSLSLPLLSSAATSLSQKSANRSASEIRDHPVRGLKEGASILSVAMAISVGKAEECGREV